MPTLALTSRTAARRAGLAEDRQLLSAFDNGQPLAELAQTHGRTRGGIQARLIRHGRLTPEGDRPIGGPGKWRPHARAREIAS